MFCFRRMSKTCKLASSTKAKTDRGAAKKRGTRAPSGPASTTKGGRTGSLSQISIMVKEGSMPKDFFQIIFLSFAVFLCQDETMNFEPKKNLGIGRRRSSRLTKNKLGSGTKNPVGNRKTSNNTGKSPQLSVLVSHESLENPWIKQCNPILNLAPSQWNSFGRSGRFNQSEY